MACEIVAELGNAANGDQNRMLRLIDAAKACGADAVKLQCYDADELVALRGNGPAPQPWGGQGYSMRALYEKAMTPWAWFPVIAVHCEKIGIPWFSSCFGERSLAYLEANGCPRYKISALEFGNATLRNMVEATGKPVIRSMPNDVAAPHYHIALYCPPGYPQSRLDLWNLRNGYDGFSYHGTDWRWAPIAVAVGARMLEVHFQLDAEPSELESHVSLGETALRSLVQSVRDAEVLLG